MRGKERKISVVLVLHSPLELLQHMTARPRKTEKVSLACNIDVVMVDSR
jgi:hypothetical protein